MLEAIKLVDCKVKTKLIGNEWLDHVRHIDIALGDCRIKLSSTHPDIFDVFDFLVVRHNHLQKPSLGSAKKKSMWFLTIAYQ